MQSTLWASSPTDALRSRVAKKRETSACMAFNDVGGGIEEVRSCDDALEVVEREKVAP